MNNPSRSTCNSSAALEYLVLYAAITVLLSLICGWLNVRIALLLGNAHRGQRYLGVEGQALYSRALEILVWVFLGSPIFTIACAIAASVMSRRWGRDLRPIWILLHVTNATNVWHCLFGVVVMWM
jgi:hypothetical protein